MIAQSAAANDEKLPPHDIEAEIAVLGSMILEPDAIRIVLEILTAADFYRGPHADLFRVLDEMAQDDEAIDLLLLRKRLQDKGLLDRIGGTSFLSRVMATVPTSANAAHYARIVRDLSRRRDVVVASARFEAASRKEDASAEWAALEMARRRLAESLRGEEDERPLILDDAADMMEEPEEGPPESLIERLIVRPGVVILFGASGSGKSWALMAGLYDLVHGGGAFCGVEGFQIKARTTRFGDEPDRVLWVYGSEDNRRRIKRRIRTCGQYGPHAGKPLGPGLFMPTSVPEGACLASPKGLAWLRRAIEQTKATVVVLDTIQSLVSSIDTNKGELVAPFMVALHQIRDATGAVIIPVHHTKKASGDAKEKIRSKADTLLGSQAWRALADGVVMIDAADGDASDAEVRLVKGKDIDEPCAPVRITMDGESKRFRPLEDEEEAPARTDARKAPPNAPADLGRPRAIDVRAVLKLRAKNPAGVPWATLWEAIGVGRSTWFRTRGELQAELLRLGHVVVGGILTWSIDPPKEDVCQPARSTSPPSEPPSTKPEATSPTSSSPSASESPSGPSRIGSPSPSGSAPECASSGTTRRSSECEGSTPRPSTERCPPSSPETAFNQSRNSPEMILGHPSVPQSRNSLPPVPCKGTGGEERLSGLDTGADGPKLDGVSQPQEGLSGLGKGSDAVEDAVRLAGDLAEIPEGDARHEEAAGLLRESVRDRAWAERATVLLDPLAAFGGSR